MRSFLRIVFLLLFVGICAQGFSSHKLDSLIKLYKDCKVDTTKARLAIKISKRIKYHENPSDSTDLIYLHQEHLNNKLSVYPNVKIAVCRALADAYSRFGNVENALRYYKEALSIASNMKDDDLVVVQIISLSQVYNAERKHDDALKILAQGMKRAKNVRNKGYVAAMYNGAAAQYQQMGNSEDAVKYFYKSLGIFEELRDTSQIISLLRNISMAHESMKDFVRSKQLLFRALDMNFKWRDSSNWSYTYGAIGALYQNMEQFDSALYYNKKQVEHFPVDIDPDSKAIAFGNLGIIYKAKKDYKRSKECYEKALAIFQAQRSYRLVTISYINLGELSILNKDYQKALTYYNEALKQTEGSAELEVLDAVHKGKYETYSAMKDYKNALSEYMVAKRLEDSLTGQQSVTRILRMENEYEVGKKQKENEVLKAQNEMKEAMIKAAKEDEFKTKIFLYSALAVILIIAVLAFQLFKNLKDNKEKNRIITEQKHLVEEKNKDITDSINYAKKIQEAILPPKELKYEIFPDGFVYFRPRDIVSGDFYWFTKKNGKRLIAAVDCTGHGVPGAFMSMIGNTFLTEIIDAKGITQPAEILSELRHMVISSLKQSHDMSESKDGMDMALLCFDDVARTVEYAGANNPMWMMRNGECIEYKADKRPIGYYRGQGLPFTNHRIEYKKGDTFYIFTDGFADQFGGENGKKFKYKQLKDILMSIQKDPMMRQEEILNARFDDWKGRLDQIDDVLVIGVRI
jgi:serine phosphatase RsbU (regulator of sigma subunit)